MMRYMLRALFFVLLVLPAPLRADVAPGPAMWKLQADGATITFLGSQHLIPASVQWLDSRVTDALNAADSVALEVDAQKAQDPAFVQQMMAAGTLPDGQTLDQVLAPEHFARLDEICTSLGFPTAGIARYKPWFAGIMLSVIHMQVMGFDPEAGADSVIDRMARAMGKQMVALETPEEQLQALLSMDALSTEELMAEATREFDDPNYLVNMLQAWATGNVAAIDTLIQEELAIYPSVYAALITNRNANWVAPVEQMIRDGGSHFVVVGAAHLIGKDSLIAMLRAKGYQIDRF